MDLTNRKFTISLPTLIGIISAISTIIGGYWYLKNTIETAKNGVVSANENYKELKSDIRYLQEQMYEIAIAHNNNVKINNKIHNKRLRNSIENEYTDDINTSSSEISPLRIKNNMDTIDLTKIKPKFEIIPRNRINKKP